MASDKSQAIAGVYAEALFELAQERGQGESVRQELSNLADLVRADPEWELFLESPAIGREHKIEVVRRVFAERLSDLTGDFLKVLASKDRLALLLEIEKCYLRLEDRQAGRVRGTLTTALELDKKELIRLSEQIGRALHKTVALQNRIDPAIIGGMIISVEDKMIDGSVRRRLQQFSRQARQRTHNRLRAENVLAAE